MDRRRCRRYESNRYVVRCVLCGRKMFAPATVRVPICGPCGLKVSSVDELRKVGEQYGK